MMVKILAFALAVVLCGGLSIYFLVKVLRGQKQFRLWLIASLFMLFISGTLLWTNLIDEVLENAATVAYTAGSATWEDEREIPDSNAMLTRLKAYTPDSLRNQIPPNFYTYFGFRDWFRFPLVYPYSITTIDFPDYGVLHNEKGIKDIASEYNHSQIVPIDDIREINFDNNMLLVKRQPNAQFESEQPPFYSLFLFGTEEIEDFTDEKALFRRAKELGYDGKEELIGLQEYGERLR